MAKRTPKVGIGPRTSQVGIGLRYFVIGVRGTIWSGSRPNGSLLFGPGVEIEAGGHLPGWLDLGSGITTAPFGRLLHFT